MKSEARSTRFPFTLTLLFALCIGIAGVAAVALVIATLELTRSTREVEHTLHVQKALEILQLTLVDAETGQRGFLLTGQPDFLKPYIEAVARQAYYIGTLERLTGDDPQQQKALHALKPLVQERLRQLSETMNVARAAGTDAARESLNRGRESMNQVRFALQGMREEEDRRLTERQLEVERRGRYGALFMLLSNGASLLGLTVLYVAMRGYHRRRRQMEAEVREREHEYREVFENVAIAQAECELQGARFARSNRKLTGMTGYSADELRHTSLIDLLPRANRLDNARTYRELVDGRRDLVTIEQPVKRKDDSLFPACIRITLARSPDNEPLYTIVVVEDLTDRMTKSNALDDTRELLSAVADTTADIVFVKDVEGRYRLANRALREALAHADGELVGMRDADILGDTAEARAMRAHDLAVLGTGTAQTFEERFTSGADARTFAVIRSPWFNATGDLVGVVGNGREIKSRA